MSPVSSVANPFVSEEVTYVFSMSEIRVSRSTKVVVGLQGQLLGSDL